MGRVAERAHQLDEAPEPDAPEAEPHTTARTLCLPQRREAYLAHLGCCEECAAPLQFDAPTTAYDWVTPLDRGGPPTTANLQILCAWPCFALKQSHDHRAPFDAAEDGEAPNNSSPVAG